MTFKPSSLAILAAVSILLTACGQRGPLYLPDQPPKKRLSQLAPPSVPGLLGASSMRPAAAGAPSTVRERPPAAALS